MCPLRESDIVKFLGPIRKTIELYNNRGVRWKIEIGKSVFNLKVEYC